MAKIILGSAKGIVPPLKFVLDKLSKKRPTFEYEVSNTYTTAKYSDDVSQEKLVNAVMVYDDAEQIGEISFGVYEGKENKDGVKPEAFGIQSHKVEKRRGTRNVLITADPAAAVRNALKLLSGKDPYQIAMGIMNTVTAPISSIAYNARHELAYKISYNTEISQLGYVEHALFGTPLTLPSDFRMEDKKKVRSCYDNYMAAKQIDRAVASNTRSASFATGYAVASLKDDSLHVVDFAKYHEYQNKIKGNKVTDAEPDFLNRYRTFDSLPKHIQDRVAVLKVAASREPIFNIGVRVSDDDEPQTFYVLHENALATPKYEDAITV
jgi:hypothetical protein